MGYIWMAAAVFAVDMLLKGHVESTKKMHEEQRLPGGWASVRRYHNTGAFLNLGEKNRTLVCACSLGLSVAVSVLFLVTLTQKGSALLKAGLALLLGGAFSNTYDRLHRKYVVDYLSFHTGIRMLDRIIFNLADFAIMIGALCMALGA